MASIASILLSNLKASGFTDMAIQLRKPKGISLSVLTKCENCLATKCLKWM